MNQNPPVGGGGSGRPIGSAAPSGHAAHDHGSVLDPDAIRDYCPVLDYGPAPDTDAARDYAVLGQPAAPVPGAATAPDPAAPGPAAGPVSAATYWRRRLAALAAGFVVLAVVAWAVNGSLGGGRAPGNAGRHGGTPSAGPAAHRHARGGKAGERPGTRGRRANGPQSLPQAGHGQPRARSLNASGAPGAGASPGAGSSAGADGAPGADSVQQDSVLRGHSGAQSPPADAEALAEPPSLQSLHPGTPGARPAAGGQRAVAQAPRPAAPVQPARATACGRGDVVLTLLSPRSWYQPQQRPLFGIDAVSTGSRPCLFNIGARYATVVVSAGRARIWGSSDCVRGSGSQMVMLTRGVPAVRWVTWDLRASTPGCRTPGPAASQGAYTAIAFDGLLSSRTMVLIVGSQGMAVP